MAMGNSVNVKGNANHDVNLQLRQMKRKIENDGDAPARQLNSGHEIGSFFQPGCE